MIDDLKALAKVIHEARMNFCWAGWRQERDPWPDKLPGDFGYEPIPYVDIAFAQAKAVLATHPSADQWRAIESAPKSTYENGRVKAIYLLGFCPDESITAEACVDVIWWEPMTKGNNGNMGCWYGNGAMEVRPTMWSTLLAPPAPSKE